MTKIQKTALRGVGIPILALAVVLGLVGPANADDPASDGAPSSAEVTAAIDYLYNRGYRMTTRISPYVHNYWEKA